MRRNPYLNAYLIQLAVLSAVASIGVLKKHCGEKRLKTWKREWLAPTDSYNAKNTHVDGSWSGNFSTAKNINHNPYPQIDSRFTAKLSVSDGAVTGELTDEFGEARISGVVHYPTIRLIKRYQVMSEETSMRRGDFGDVYYEGTFGEDNSLSGEWFLNPFDRTKWCGTWDMKRLAP